jgi:hypothetical protein
MRKSANQTTGWVLVAGAVLCLAAMAPADAACEFACVGTPCFQFKPNENDLLRVIVIDDYTNEYPNELPYCYMEMHNPTSNTQGCNGPGYRATPCKFTSNDANCDPWSPWSIDSARTHWMNAYDTCSEPEGTEFPLYCCSYCGGS